MKTNGIGILGSAALVLALGACATTPMRRDRLVRTPATCVDQTVQIYFDEQSAEVTPEGRAVLKLAATEAKGCKVRMVTVLGLADAKGDDPAANLDLSRRRAQAVTAALTATGLPASDYELAAAGQQGAVTRSGDARPLRRRADIILHLAPQ